MQNVIWLSQIYFLRYAMINAILATPKVTFQAQPISQKCLDKYSTVVVILNNFDKASITALPYGDLLFKRHEDSIKSDTLCLSAVLPNDIGSQVILFHKNNMDSFTYLTALRKALQKFTQLGVKLALVDLSGSEFASKEVLRVLYLSLIHI